MNDPGSRNHARNLGGCLLVVVGLTASLAEILNYLGVRPPEVPRLVQPAQARPPEAPAPASPPRPPEPAGRPARLVLVVENYGEMPAVARAAAATAVRLAPDDTVSLIAYVGSRHVWIFRDEPGDRGRAEVVARARTLFSVSRPPDRTAAVADALGYLAREPKPGPNPAVVVLSAAVDDDTLDRWLNQIRTGACRPARVFALDGGGADSPR